MKIAKEMVIVSETHWDREWYLPFQEYRAKLVILIDKLLEILEKNPNFTNFTFDGQTIVLEDYLEVKPENKPLLEKYIGEKRISVGPWYVLPDEFLVSGEALIRNLMLGHKIGRSFGRVMRAGYIPDPFGHIAQLPQIMKGFDIDSIIFMRGMDDSAERLGLNLEFQWNAPGKIDSVLAIHLEYGYGSVALLSTTKINNVYKAALNKIRKLQKKLLEKSAYSILLLNNGSDHDEVQGELPEIIEDWNNSPELNEFKLVQSDFEYYIERLKTQIVELISYEGELRGARYHPLLSGVFSARMWIKQTNTECQYLLESWAEPFSAFAWLLGQPYPKNYLWAGWRWLLQNHPHDSICGCSIDDVHQNMVTRFNWANQIAQEIIKDAMFAIFNRIQIQKTEKEVIPILIFNSLPWDRADIASIDLMVPEPMMGFKYKLLDSMDRVIPFQMSLIEEPPRFRVPKCISYRIFFFLQDLPACGYEVLRFIPESALSENESRFSPTNLENEFYKITINENGTFSIFDKEMQKTFNNLGIIEDKGDWGDEYDYSPPKISEVDQTVTNEDIIADISVYEAGPVKNTVLIKYSLNLPSSLSPDKGMRSESYKELPIQTFVTLYSNIKRIDLKIQLDNQSKDHRIRILFPTGLSSDKVHVDGHFAIIDRTIDLPKGLNWNQPPSKTNHQLKFVSINDSDIGITICNRGLPEYEAIREKDGNITLAVTLLRCIGRLADINLATRKELAGPPLETPEAQCLGPHTFHLAIVTHMQTCLDSKSFRTAYEFNIPPMAFNPSVMRSMLRIPDHIFLKGLPIYRQPDYFGEKYIPERQSFLSIDPNCLILSACKKAEEEEALIIRLYNFSADTQQGTITLFQTIQNIKIVNLNEQEILDSHISDLHIENHQFSFQIDGFKIATFKVFFQ